MISDIEYNFKMFKNIQEIYKMENPNHKPVTETLPTSIKIAI